MNAMVGERNSPVLSYLLNGTIILLGMVLVAGALLGVRYLRAQPESAAAPAIEARPTSLRAGVERD